ncbi:MAG TPA: SBBP repeat-containing protein [Polyangiaceae bacterium]|nr:SBBP repeat-containing protein [Polyangiaceae bacterium]
MNVVLALFVLTLVSPGSSVHRGEVTPPPTARKSGLTPAAHGSLPLRFEQNVGQGVDGARFLSFGASLALFDDRATIALPRSAATGGDGGGDDDADVRVQLMVAGGRRVTPRAEDLLVTRSNYFLGPERSRWFTDIPNFGRIVYASVRDGVDLVFHGEGGQLEYDFVLAPGADPSSLVLEVGGAKDLSLTADGHLAIRTERGVLVQREPRVFQRTSAGALEDVPAGYRLLGARTFAFEVASYDATRELVIDPVLEYSTFLGGRSSDGAMSVAVDAAGSAYLAGTASPGFPLQATIGGPSGLAFVAKLTPSGNNLVYATAVAGTGDAIALAIDSSGCAYVGGSTISDDLPLVNAVQTARAGVGDAYLFKVSADGGSLLYSTYFGGGLREEIEHIAVDAAGSAFVVGSTASSDLPTRNALRPAGGQLEAFVAKFGPGGSVDYATYLGGTRDDLGHGIAIDSLGSAYIVGSTSSPDFPTVDAVQPTYVLPAGFVTKLAPSGAAIEFSTFIGSNGSELRSVVVDAAGSAFVTGTANPAPLPVTRRFLADVGVGMVALKLSPNGRAVDYLATFGTSTFGRDIAVDSRGSAIVVGTTTRPIPTQSPVQPTYGGGGNDGVLFKLSPDGQALELSTYLGGSSIEFVTGVAVDSLGGAYLVGTTNSSDFPVVNAIQPGKAATSDAFVAKIFPPPYLSPPTATVPPRGSLALAATSGSGAGYTFAFRTNASGGTLGATGAYVAGATPSVLDEVTVTDSRGNSAVALITVGPGVTLTPMSPTVVPGAAFRFTATGGSGAGYVYAVTSSGSGGTIDAMTGAYLAGATIASVDVVAVVDSLGNTASTNVRVEPPAPADAGPDAADAAVRDAAPETTRDSGAVTDAAQPDATRPTDATPPPSDAGASGADASMPDASPPGAGCTCRSSPSAAGDAGTAVLLAGVVAIALRRRQLRRGRIGFPYPG